MADFSGRKRRTNHKRGIKQQEQERRRKEAEERTAKWNKLSPQEKLNALDKRLGIGVGAKKQRDKFTAQITRAQTPPPNPMKLANEAMAKAFNATPEEMGKAAVKQAARAEKQRKKGAADKVTRVSNPK